MINPIASAARLSFWQRVRGLLELLRPLNVVLFVVGVVVGGVLVAGAEALGGVALRRLLLAAVSAALIGGAANSINDVFDFAIDRVNRPDRPLPAGRVTPRQARIWAGVVGAAGMGISWWISGVHAALAVGAAALLYLYSARLKRTPLVGNLVVALVVALALVYGGLAVGPVDPALVGALFAMLTTLAREIVKDVEDSRGDAAAAARTLPLVLGRRMVLRLVAGVVGLTLALTPLPFLLLGYNGLYLLVVLATDALLLRALWLLLEEPPGRQAGRASRTLKLAMLAGLAALACAGLAG